MVLCFFFFTRPSSWNENMKFAVYVKVSLSPDVQWISETGGYWHQEWFKLSSLWILIGARKSMQNRVAAAARPLPGAEMDFRWAESPAGGKQCWGGRGIGQGSWCEAWLTEAWGSLLGIEGRKWKLPWERAEWGQLARGWAPEKGFVPVTGVWRQSWPGRRIKFRMASTLPPQSSAGGIFIHGDHRRHHHHDDIRWDGVCPADQKEPDCQWENQHIHSDQVALQKDVYYSQQRCVFFSCTKKHEQCP